MAIVFPHVIEDLSSSLGLLGQPFILYVCSYLSSHRYKHQTLKISHWPRPNTYSLWKKEDGVRSTILPSHIPFPIDFIKKFCHSWVRGKP
jgi:hypothetical protein